MTQRFLLSAKVRTLSLKAVYAMGEDKAYEVFCGLRCADKKGEPVCPRCGCIEAYKITTRRRFKCMACSYQYSVSSGTILASRKMSFADLLAAVCILADAAKGVSALQLARDLDCQHMTAFVLAHKLREAMAAETKGATFYDVVEIDGAYFGGHIRPANLVEQRVDRRLAQPQSGKRRVVVALRQRKGRTLTFVTKHEYEVSISRSRLSPAPPRCTPTTRYIGTRCRTAGIPCGSTTSKPTVLRAAQTKPSPNFSRLHRMVEGKHHHVTPRYLHQYASHAAWIKDHRRLDNGALARRAFGLALTQGVSRNWAGYWQRAA